MDVTFFSLAPISARTHDCRYRNAIWKIAMTNDLMIRNEIAERNKLHLLCARSAHYQISLPVTPRLFGLRA